MTLTNDSTPSFNLWKEPWIQLEDFHSELTHHSISEALVKAHEYAAIYDPSPLVVVGIHRLLTAILQDALKPQENADLEYLWNEGHFPQNKIEIFEREYSDHFDLFSEDKPFLQSANLPIFPGEKGIKASKSVAQLFPERPSGSLVTHYRHVTGEEQVFSPATAALGLVTMPPFVSSGGAGLMPSINGVPPIYVLPSGKTLFESLVASLLTTHWIEDYATAQSDLAWWKRTAPVIIHESKKKKPNMKYTEHRQLSEVGYLHGLTFPARRVRLHPERINAICSRSGKKCEWIVRTMTFSMGESCLDDVNWRDPFVAYRQPSKTTGKRKTSVPIKSTDKPKPIRPMRGRVSWREFSGLFLQHDKENQQSSRPLFLNQLAELKMSKRIQTYPFRCVAWQTDGKMKYFEWMDFGFDVPPSLLQEPNGAELTDQALSFATDCAGTIKRIFSSNFRRDAKSPERFRRLKVRLEADYWSSLGDLFRKFVLDLGDHTRQIEILNGWFDAAMNEALISFEHAADATGDNGNTLLKIEKGKEDCRKQCNILRNKTKHGG